METMEKKQLNFSAPLMSARRHSSPLRPSGEDKKRDTPAESQIPLPSQQSDLNLGEVVKPGSIPFIWEQTPGKAKCGRETHKPRREELPTMPFPPGKKSGELTGFRTPNKFSGELVVLRSRNKLSGELSFVKHHKFAGELNTLRPRNKLSGELGVVKPLKLSGELNTFRPNNRFSGELSTLRAKFCSLNDGMVRWDSSKVGTDINANSESRNNDDNDDDDDSLSDALGTFSQQDSLSMNCSISGLSGVERAETKPSENLSTDAKTRDFMMDRFLPAAKAMTLEPSQYASRKQLVVVEQQKEVRALVPRVKTLPPGQNLCNIVPYTGQDIGSEDTEEEEDGYDERSTISVKVKACGFLPWFCSKNSLRLINPLPSVKDKSKSALSSASKVGNLVRTMSWKSTSQKLAKHDPCSNHKHKVAPAYKSCELQKPKHTSRPMFYSGELHTRSGSPYRSSRRSSVSPHRNESSHSLYQNGGGVLAVPKRVDSHDDNRLKAAQKGSKRFEEPRKNTRGSGPRGPVVEKILYIDSVNIPKVSNSILNLPKIKRRVDGLSNECEGRLEIMKARGMSGPLVCGGVDSSEPSKMSEKVNKNTCRELVLVSDDTTALQSSLTPPLPKSPSESWLSRHLPQVSPRVSPRNSVSYLSMNSKLMSRKQNAKAVASGAKWETIVKSSHLRQDDGRYSEELTPRFPQQPQIWK